MARFIFLCMVTMGWVLLTGCGAIGGELTRTSATVAMPTATVVAMVSEAGTATPRFVLNEASDPHLGQRTRNAAVPRTGGGTPTVLRPKTPAGGVLRGTRVFSVTLGVATPEYGEGRSNVERAQAVLEGEGLQFALVVVSANSVGVEGEIFRDLTKRNFRATAGADEGFDTERVGCHPHCVFVRYNAVNEISVESWTNVLRHEYRHTVQAANHPHLAEAFRRTPDSMFTTYAAFLEACADDGIFVAEPTYHASERMPRVRVALGAEGADVLRRACAGFTDAYDTVLKSFELKVGEGSFGELFPPYK